MHSAPVSVRHYVVAVETGTEENSGTDTTVHITLFGTLGDTGRRYLINNNEQKKKFRTGKVDTFIVEAVDLGRLENIIIGHDGKGAEAAWFLEKVSVKEGVDAKHKYIFTCNSWLQDEEDYGIVEVELYMDRMEKENDNLQKQNLNTVAWEDSEREGGEQGREERIKEDMRSIEGEGIKEDEVTDTTKEEEIKQGKKNIQGEGVTEDTNKTEDDKSGIKDMRSIEGINEDEVTDTSKEEGIKEDMRSIEGQGIKEDEVTDTGKEEAIKEAMRSIDGEGKKEDEVTDTNKEEVIKEDMRSIEGEGIKEDEVTDTNKEEEIKEVIESILGEGVTEDTNKLEDQNTNNKSGIKDKTESRNKNNIPENNDVDMNKNESEDIYKTESGNQNKITEDNDIDNDKRNEDTSKAKNDQSDVTEDSNVENKTESEDTNKTESEDTHKTDSEDTNKPESEDQNKATEDKS